MKGYNGGFMPGDIVQINTHYETELINGMIGRVLSREEALKQRPELWSNGFSGDTVPVQWFDGFRDQGWHYSSLTKNIKKKEILEDTRSYLSAVTSDN